MRLIAIGLTLGVAAIVLMALVLVLLGPTFAQRLGQTTGWGAPFSGRGSYTSGLLVRGDDHRHRCSLLLRTAPGANLGMDHDLGAVAATVLWLVSSLLFKLYVANLSGDYEATYGTWVESWSSCVSRYHLELPSWRVPGLNAEIQTRVSTGKSPGQRNAQGTVL